MTTDYYFKGINKLKTRESDTLKRIDSVLERLREFEGCSLKVRHRKGATERYLVKYVDKKCVQTYLTDDQTYHCLLNYRFFRTFRKLIIKNLRALESSITDYEEYNLDSIMRKLPATYRAITPEIESFFSLVDIEAWKNNLLEIKRQYPPSHPENLQFKTSDGTPVRSKSEVIIYEILLKHSFAFVYDAPYRCADGSIKHPDFTILKPDGRGVMLIEHDGAFHDALKRGITTRKMGEYYDNGLDFYEEILFTFDRSNRSINAELIEEIILDCLYN